MRSRSLVGIDTGGTFTDFLLVQGSRVEIFKILSTPRDPAKAVLAGLAEVKKRLGGDPDQVTHGFTVATNALLTRDGAKTVLVTTEGFEDLLAIGRQARPDLYALLPRAVEPLVEDGHTVGVRERIGPDGAQEKRLSKTEIARVARMVERLSPEAVAICFLHSYKEPGHEQAVARGLRKVLGKEVPVAVSSDVTREYREFERASTTTVSAYLSPTVCTYLKKLSRRIRPRLRIMQSNGGAVPASSVAERPVLSVLSGPAGGVLGAAEIGRRARVPNLLTLDVGGTSTDVAVVPGGVRTTKEAEVGGFPLRIPMIEMETVGAGGGSIARVDRGGALAVGPESAGADPGPACYGRGGPVTVTDAHVVLGRIDAERFADGNFSLDVDASWRVVGELARKLGFRSKGAAKQDARRAARGVVQVANATIERALRVVSVARGFDVREFGLLAFGGAGGLHAAELGHGLAVREVIIPPHAGVLSAWGLLVAQEIHPLAQTVLWSLDAAHLKRCAGVFAEMQRQARANWGSGLRYEKSADLRYRGQSFEIEVPWGKDVENAFHRAHRDRYGYARPTQPIEVVNLNLQATRPGFRLPEFRLKGGSDSYHKETVLLDNGSSVRKAPIYERDGLSARSRVRGPALIVEYGATTYVPPGFRVRIDSKGNLRMSE